MKQETLRFLVDTVGEDYVLTGAEQKLAYLYDEIEHSLRPEADMASVVVKPNSTAEISAIMRHASQNAVPVVVRGGGTGLCGAAIPTKASIVLSMERMNRIIEVDEENMMAVLESGVTLADLIEELDKHNDICFPVHPGDEGCQMGGMAVCNAGGARAVRHGITRSHIKGMEVVLPSGEVLQLGGKLLKDNAGYNLMQLIMGSEGTLAVVTTITLRLYPQERYTASIVASFASIDEASAAVTEVVKSGVSPLAVEYQDKRLNVATAELLGLHWPETEGEADLILILSEKTEANLLASCEVIEGICQKHGVNDAVIATTRQEQADVLAVRSGSYEVIKDDIYHSFDMAVPPGSMPRFLHDLWDMVAAYGTRTNITAHIADGNVHNDILYVDGKVPPYHEELKNKMYELCFSLGGTITGEHGIGKLRTEDLKLQKNPAELALMYGIKKVFDPQNILNPGTVLNEADVNEYAS